MHNKSKRITAMLLAIAMVLSMIPSSVLADEVDDPVAQESCIGITEGAPATAEVSAGGLYELPLASVFTDSESHNVEYTYEIAEEGYSEEHTKIENGKFYFSAPKQGESFNVTLTARCSEGEVSHGIKITVTEANAGIDAQYGYDETDKSSVTVYVTISNDGVPIRAIDDTVMANLEVTVPYFDLGLYGLENYYRYETENGLRGGDYKNDKLIRRPTGLHLYIYLLEKYYMGLSEDQCCTGVSNLFDYVSDNPVLYMDGDVAYESKGLKALAVTGGAKSIYMRNFWGHDENLMYFRNHCYPYMGPGWGSTSDYILLSDGDTWDVGMFSNWNFYAAGGGFVSFDKDEYKVNAGDTLKVEAFKWGTSEKAKEFEDVNGDVGLGVVLYDSEWEIVVDAECEYTADNDNEITVTIPEGLADGTYYIMATDPRAITTDAKYAPGVSRVIVGEEKTGVDVTECQQHTNNDNDHICDVCTMTVSECADADNDDECDVCGKYIVTINVGPSTANVSFYSGSDTTNALTTEVKDNGVVNEYHQYILTVPEGTYTYRGTDGETDLGGMTFKIPLNEEVMADGTASGEGQSMALRRANYYTSNANITNAGDYTLNLIPAGLPDVVNGEQYIDDNNKVVTPVLVMARGNALVYNEQIIINGELGETLAVEPEANVTFGQAKNANNKTFYLSDVVYHTITAPEEAKVQVFNQLNNFNVEEIPAKTVSEADENGIVTYSFKTSGGGNLTYRVSMDGKITRAGYFGNTAETINVTFEENEDPKATGHKLDDATIQKRMEASTMLNVNAQNNLRIDKDETFRLRGYRGAWQIINTDTMNIMIEPDFHYNIISGEEHIKVDVVDDVCTGNATGNWLDITGVSEGTAIVEITYDAIQIGGNGTTYDGFYGATDPQRKGLVVIQVGEGENTLKMTAEGRSNVWDVEFDTVYTMGDTAELTFTATMGEAIPEKAELSVDNGKTWTDVSFADGKFTVDGLVGGNNIIRFTKGDATEYQIVRAAKVTRTVTNLSRADGIISGDTLKVVYDGLYTPVSKISGIYNPGYGQGHAITYNVPDGYTVSTTGGQYDFISTNSYTITIPETAKGEVKLTGGYIAFNVMGTPDPIGAHRTLTDAGCGMNFSAYSTQHTRSILPDLTFTVIDMPYIDVTVATDVDGATIVVKDSTGAELTAENGVYKLPLGTYSYTASLDGYITERGSFDVGMKDAENNAKTVSVKMRKVEGAIWDGKTTTAPQKDANGVYQIGTGAELAWFATNHGNANAVLTADISLGGFNWTPITAYKGTFDGNGHWVTDLYINASADKQALFAQLSSNGVIRNLGVRGQVTSTGKKIGGIVAEIRNKATIDGCVSDVTVTGSQYVGGIAGQQYMSSTIKNCYNIGDITSTHKNGCAGGISGGYTTATTAFTVENCYNLGVVTASKYYGGLTYSTKAENGVNSYYAAGTADNGDSKVGTVKTAAELKAMAETLGEAYTADKNNINGGFPILTWQVTEAEEEVIYGDVDGSGDVKTSDVLLVLKFIGGDTNLDENAEKAADVDGDGSVKTSDVLLVLKFIGGDIVNFPVED